MAAGVDSLNIAAAAAIACYALGRRPTRPGRVVEPPAEPGAAEPGGVGPGAAGVTGRRV
jgi:hypothetical protein